MIQRLIPVFLALVLSMQAAFAQNVTVPQDEGETFYIQLAASTSLADARERVQEFSAQLDNVAGFALGGGWYNVALGPYTRAQAEEQIARLQAAQRIPNDSYIEDGAVFGQQYWPVGQQTDGAAVEPEQQAADPATDPATPVVNEAPEPAAQPSPEPEPQETVQEARAAERQLTREERDALQVALKWAGFYQGAIDGAFGPGTRGAMSNWQQANDYEATGVLTTQQRAALLGQYNAVLDGMGLALVEDPNAGIAMKLPMGVMEFDRYDSPFAVFEPTTDLGARVLLVSQPGDGETLAGLYEILQTLEIVPLDGERSRDRNGFVLNGANDRIVTRFEVGLRDGQIKGFGLVWPAGDEDRRGRVLKEMQDSYRRIPGMLDPAEISDDSQAVDLVSGLEVRTPKATASGFFIEARGTVLTSHELVQNCDYITLDDVHEARVLASDEALGIAILTPQERLAPRRVAQFRSGSARLQSEVAVAGFSFGGVLGAPTLTFGTLEDVRGLTGDDRVERLALSAMPGDVGGPVFDTGGTVLGMLLPKTQPDGRILPEQVSFVAKGPMIVDFLRNNGIQPVARSGLDPVAPEDLTALAADVTVLVSCW